MSPTAAIPWRHFTVVVLLALTMLALTAPLAPAADGHLAFDMFEIVSNRSRLIQFSIGAVALGIALLWWGKN
jgi:hypothetical protein